MADSLAELCRRIKFKATPGSKPCPWDKRDPCQREHFRCTLSMDGRRMVVDFWGSVGSSKPPKCVDVLDCCLSDAGSYEDSTDIDDFHRNFCEGLGVSETLRIFNACKNRCKSLKRVLGADYDRFRNAERP